MNQTFNIVSKKQTCKYYLKIPKYAVVQRKIQMITIKPLVTDKHQQFWSRQKECAIKYLKDLNILPKLS